MENKELQKTALFPVVEADQNLRGIHKDFYACKTVSVEGLGDIIEGLGNMFTKRINYITGFFSSKNKKSFSTEVSESISSYHKELKLKEYMVDEIIRNKAVTEVLNTLIAIPLGMKVGYPEASKLISGAMDIIEDKIFPLLDGVDSKLSEVISDEAHRLSSRPTTLNKEIKDVNRDLGKVLNKIINPNGKEEFVKVREVFPNVASLKDVYNTLLKTSNINNLKNLHNIYAVSESIRNKCEELYALSNNNPGFRIKKPVLTNLMEDLEEAAYLVTNSAAVINFYIDLVKYYMLLLNSIANPK